MDDFAEAEDCCADKVNAEEIALRLGDMIPPGVAVLAGPIEDFTTSLFPEELDTIANSVAKRRQAFSTGRALARQALSHLGQAAVAIPVGDHRAPLWPDGMTGSISHSRRVCAAIAARVSQVPILGLDIEWSGDVSDKLMARISTPAEIIRNRREVSAHDLAACLFSAREAVFKAYNPITQAWLDFRDVEIDLNGRRGAFEARLVNPRRPALFGRRTFEGRYAVVRGFVIAVVATKA